VQADCEQHQGAGGAGDVREHFDRLLVVGVLRNQRRDHRRRYERPERAYQPRVRGRDPPDCNWKNPDRFRYVVTCIRRGRIMVEFTKYRCYDTILRTSHVQCLTILPPPLILPLIIFN